MGLFDFLKSKDKSDAPRESGVDKNLLRLARVAADRHAQNYDRMEAIHSLAALGTADAATALLKRFTYYVEPSITDQEEKEVAFRGVLSAREQAIEPIREFCGRAESLTWPLKLLEEILPEDGYVDEMLTLLTRFDTDYTRNVEPKLQVISALESRKRKDVLEAVEPFLEDFDEPVRFHTVATVFAQENTSSAVPLCRTLIAEESVRVKNRICEGFVSRGWPIPDDMLREAQKAIPPGYVLDGNVVRRGR